MKRDESPGTAEEYLDYAARESEHHQTDTLEEVVGTLREIIALHSKGRLGECEHCLDDYCGETESASYPCPTRQIIDRHLGNKYLG